MRIIARIHTDFPTKFGIPRQSGITPELLGRVVFEPEYRNTDALRGLEDFSHVWLIWEFSEARKERWAATVRPPRLGGNTRLGVFATRSPYRPNPIGLSSVRLERVEQDAKLGPVLVVSGVDMLDGTPIYDIKPYLPLSDCHPEAKAGFAANTAVDPLSVCFPEPLLEKVPEDMRKALLHVLRQDPRPSYQDDPQRRYGVPFAGLDIRFTVDKDTLTVREVVPYQGNPQAKDNQ